MKILAIESSCDETAVSIVENGRDVISSVIASQVKEHQKYGGVFPEVASRKHIECITLVTEQALEKAKMEFKHINAIAVTYAPGLIGSLLVGVNFAKGLSFATKLPLIPVHHLKSHVAANYITHKKLKPPFLCLIVSGGHSHIVDVIDYTDFKIIGRKRDDAAGEVFDKVARMIGLPYPGGVYLDVIAQRGDAYSFDLPRPKVYGEPYDFSFSGLKTAAVNIVHNANQRQEEINKENLAASFRCAVVDCLIQKFMLAARNFNRKKLVVAGGVSANSHLRERLIVECKEKSLELYMPDLKFCGDNAAMVASQGYYEYLSGNIAKNDLNAQATLSITS